MLAYSKAVLTEGMILREFQDGIREGDGNRLERCYKYLLAFFFHTGHKKYAIECFRYLCSMKIEDVSTPEQAAQMKWSRFVNIHGKKGSNIPTDLHMEHLNRVVKRLVLGMGANVSKEAIVNASKCINNLGKVTTSIDRTLDVKR